MPGNYPVALQQDAIRALGQMHGLPLPDPAGPQDALTRALMRHADFPFEVLQTLVDTVVGMQVPVPPEALSAARADLEQRVHRIAAGSELTVEAARAALVAMIESAPPAYDPVPYTLEAVKTQAPREGPGGRVFIGPWECDLVHRTFVFANIRPPFYFAQVGQFVRTEEGKWKAIVTETTRN